jgi:hypothetical protein
VRADRSIQVEAHSIPAFIELVVKLNEAAFRPLFRKLHDWAFTNDGGESISCVVSKCHLYEVLIATSDARKISFFRIYSSLLDFFKVSSKMLFRSAVSMMFPGSDEHLHVVLIATIH